MVQHVLQSAQMVSLPVLVFDVGEDLHIIKSNLFVISQAQAVIRHVRENKSLDPEEIQTCACAAESL